MTVFGGPLFYLPWQGLAVIALSVFGVPLLLGGSMAKCTGPGLPALPSSPATHQPRDLGLSVPQFLHLLVCRTVVRLK